MRPISVSAPVAVITNRPRPPTTSVPMCTRECRSERPAEARAVASAVFVTGRDSPVSNDSSTSRPWDSKTRPSAGTASPASTRITSPGTSSAPAKSDRAGSVELLQRVQGPFRLELLHEPDDDVHRDREQGDEPGQVMMDRERDRGGAHEHEDEWAADEVGVKQKRSAAVGFRQPGGPVRLRPDGRLRPREA